MKLIKSKEFNGEWLRSRFEVCKLPTEFVLPNYYTGDMTMPTFNIAYGYRLPAKEYPPKQESGHKYQSYHYQIAIEIHEDHGDDGHTKYQFMNQLVIIYENEVPKTLKEYQQLVSDAYELEKEERDPACQLNLYKWSWLSW